MSLIAKRTIMILYSDERCPYSHQVRIVLAEKGINVDIQHVSPQYLPQDLIDINPYYSLPTLVDRDLVLYNAPIIMEYLDERFPHPPLLPVYPVARATSRKLLFRVEQDWYRLLRIIVAGAAEQVAQARQQLKDSLVSINAVFADQDYFLSQDFSLIDCCIAPLLWRLPQLGIELPPQAKAIHEYAERVFSRKSFQESLSECERELRAA